MTTQPTLCDLLSECADELERGAPWASDFHGEREQVKARAAALRAAHARLKQEMNDATLNIALAGQAGDVHAEYIFTAIQRCIARVNLGPLRANPTEIPPSAQNLPKGSDEGPG